MCLLADERKVNFYIPELFLFLYETPIIHRYSWLNKSIKIHKEKNSEVCLGEFWCRIGTLQQRRESLLSL